MKSLDPYKSGPFYLKWKDPEGTYRITRYMYDHESSWMRNHTRKQWVRLSIKSGRSVGWEYLGRAKRSEYEEYTST